MIVRRSFPVVSTIAAVALLAGPALAQSTTPEKYLELLRTDVRTAKTEIMTEALELTDAQATAFWPIYREYDTELSALGDRRIALIKTFAAKYGTMTDADASTFAKDYFALHKDRLKLREKYFDRAAKATSSVIAARFIQVETVVGNLIDLQIAAELPLFE